MPGAEISTALAPASRCAAAFSRAVKSPVHSSATSMPRSAQGSRAGSRSLSTRIGPAPMSMVPSPTATLPGKRPCTES